MTFDPAVFDHNTFDVVQAAIYKYTSDNEYWQSLKCVVEIYDNRGETLLLSYDSFNPEAYTNTVKLLECSVTLGLSNTQFSIRFYDENGIIDQNNIGLGNKVLIYAGRESNDLTLLFTGYSESRTPIILGDNVMDYQMEGHGENASLNDIIVNFKRASSQLVDIEDPNFPKRPDSKMVAFELVKDLFEDSDVRVTKDIILKDYLKLNISGISPLVTERLLSIVQNLREASAVLNFLAEVTGAYWNIENGKLYFEYPETKHSGITIKNKPESTDLAASTSYFINQWRYTDSISKSDGFANRIYTTTAVDTKSVANAMTNQGATSLFDRAIAQQVTLTETRVNTLAFILSRIGDPFTTIPEELGEARGGIPSNAAPNAPTCPTGYHLNTATNTCVPDVVCPTGYHLDTNTNQCVPDSPPGTVITGWTYDFSFGEQGSGNGQFDTIEGIGVDSQDNIYVVDAGLNSPENASIHKFSNTGQFIMKFGSYGSENGQLDTPYDVKIDPRGNGHIWVADQYNNRIQEFDENGNYLSQIGPTIAGLTNPDTLYIPEVICFDPVDYSLYISDTDHHRIVKLDANRNFVRQWGSQGNSDGQFQTPHGMAISPVNRHLYISNHQDARIQEFDGNGTFIRKWGTQGNNPDLRQFIVPKEHISVNKDGWVFQTNGDDIPYIIVFDSTGNYKTKFGSPIPGSGPGQLREPESSISDSNYKVFVTNQENHRVEVYKPVYSVPPITPTCPSGYTWNSTTKTCVPNTPPTCPTNYHWSTTEQKCVANNCPSGYHWDTNTNQCVPDSPVETPVCPIGYHWDTNSQQCVLNNPPTGGGGEGQIDSYGIEWLVASGQQFVVDQSRDESNDDRWSGNISGLRQGAEATMIAKSIGTAGGGEAHFAMKIGGGNHSGSGSSSQRWYDLGFRDNGELQLQWEGPHPDNHDFNLPSKCKFITNLGKGLEGNWIGLKWCVQTVTPNSTPANGGVRVRMWVDRNAINAQGKPNNNWELVIDFVDGVDAQVISPQTYAMPDTWDCEVRRSDTDRHDVYGTGSIITDSSEGDPGLHVRRLGTGVVIPPTQPVCPSGYHWDGLLKRCIRDTQPPPTGGGQLDFNIAGDFRGTSATGTNLVSNSPDIILCTGDYGIDYDPEDWWNNTMSMWSDSGIETWGARGNHDSNDYINIPIFKNNTWKWTVKKNGIAFIGCDTITEDYNDADTRCQEAFNDPNVHTIIPLMHEGIWHPEGTSVSSDTVIEFHETFKKYKPKLKMVVCGHTHVYGRMKPVDGILYVMNGVGGQNPSSGSTSPSPFHRINGTLHCTLNTDGSITCSSVANAGQAPNPIMDSFTIKADGTLPTDGVNVRPRTILPTFEDLNTLHPDTKAARLAARAEKPPLVTNPDRPSLTRKGKVKKCLPFMCPMSVRATDTQVSEAGVYTYDTENNIVQSAPVTNVEQVIDGEIRIDVDNKPIGPVISQFKVNVGGLSSTADTIFVNDIKVDPSVLSPTAKYWIVLLPVGTSNRSTILWHHDNDLVTPKKEGIYAAFAKGKTRSSLSDWQVSTHGPTYTHAVFARLRRIQEYSDPQSIYKFRLKEDIAEADFLDDATSVAKLMQNVLAIRGKPVRKYEVNDVTLPLDKWFTPGQNVTIVDDTGHHEEDKNIFAEIQEVTYSWDTGSAEDTIGTFRVRVLPVGHLNWHKEQFPSGD